MSKKYTECALHGKQEIGLLCTHLAHSLAEWELGWKPEVRSYYSLSTFGHLFINILYFFNAKGAKERKNNDSDNIRRGVSLSKENIL